MPAGTVIQVILPLKLEWEPFYMTSSPVTVGQRVLVTFSRRQYTAVVHKVVAEPDSGTEHILDIDDADPGLAPVSDKELQLWEFIASYYLCTIGEVYAAAYPYGKIKSENVAVRANANARRREEAETASLNRRLLGLKDRFARKEALIERRKGSAKADPAVTAELERQLESIRSQMTVLQDRLDAILRKAADTVLPAQNQSKPEKPGRPELICSAERHIRYIEECSRTLGSGRSVLILSPDTVSCEALRSLLAHEFPDLLVCTSKSSQAQRRRIADAARSGAAMVVIGTRSAIFLPFSNLGLVIVDEEQDVFYKQDEPSPRYNGRDCAIKLAMIHGARTILGSSRPSLETLLNVRSGKYSASACTSFGSAAIETVDMGAEKRKKGVYGYFSFKLIEAIRNTDGKVALIRGWERPEELQVQIQELFPERQVDVFRYQQIREKDLSDYALTAVMQADALVDPEDFRADERGAAISTQLSSRCRSLWIQTSVRERFDCSRSPEELLEERMTFGFPPYTRLVEYRQKGTARTLQRFFLKKDASLYADKEEIRKGIPKGAYVDVDPL